MHIRVLVFVLFSFLVACSDTKDSSSPMATPPKSTPEAQTKSEQPQEKMLSSEMSGSKLVIKLGDQTLTEIENGELIDESGRFLAYKMGSSSVLVHNSGKTLFTCNDTCLVKVSENYASIQWGPGQGSLYDLKGDSIYSSDTSEEVFYKISNTFASVSSQSSAKVFQVSKGTIYSCSDVQCSISLSDTFAAITSGSSAALFQVDQGRVYSCSSVNCNLMVSDNFAAVIDTRDSSGNLIGHDGNIIYSFSVPGRVKLSNTFAAVSFSDGGVLYHSDKGSIFHSSVPVTFVLSDEEARVKENGRSDWIFGVDGNTK